MSDPKPEPVRVKMYGLFRITRERYIRQLVMTGMMAVCLLVGWFMVRATVAPDLSQLGKPIFIDADGQPVEYAPHADRPLTTAPDDLLRLIRLLNFLPWVVIILLVLAAVEARFVLRRFAEKEADQRREAERKAADVAAKEKELTVATAAEKTETGNGTAPSSQSSDAPQPAADPPESSTP